jgi:hypothetical protein
MMKDDQAPGGDQAWIAAAAWIRDPTRSDG